MNIVVAMPAGAIRTSFFPQSELDYLAALGEAWINPNERWLTSEEWAKVLPEAHAAVTGWGAPRFNEELLRHAPKLKIIAHTGGSVAGLADKALYDRGIKLVSANEVYAQSVAEGVIGYILAAQRDIPFWHKRMSEGGWGDPNRRPTNSLLEKRVGLIGFGAVSRFLVPMLRAFSCEVVAYDPFVDEERMGALGVRKVSLEEALNCPIVSLHAPKMPETDGLIGRAQLALMPHDALLVNTARGNLLDEEALCDAVREGRIRCMLDVYEPEPPAEDHPIRKLDGALLIPHMAGPTVDRRPTATRFVLEEIARAFIGEKLLHEIPHEYAIRMTQ